MSAELLKKISKLVGDLAKDRKYDGYRGHSSVSVCECGHVTTCQTCSSNDDRMRYERVSEIGR